MKVHAIVKTAACCVAAMAIVGCASIRAVIDAQTALGQDPGAEEAVDRLVNPVDLENVLKNGKNENARVAAGKKCNNEALFKNLVCSGKESSAIRKMAFQRLVELKAAERMILEDESFAIVILTGGDSNSSDPRRIMMSRKYATRATARGVKSQGGTTVGERISFPPEYRIKAIDALKDNVVMPSVVMDENAPVSVRIAAVKKARLSKQEFVAILEKSADEKYAKKNECREIVKAYIDSGELLNKGIVEIICGSADGVSVSLSGRKLALSYVTNEEDHMDILRRTMQGILEDSMIKKSDSDEVKFAKYLISCEKQEVLAKLIMEGYYWRHTSFLVECANKITDDNLLVAISERKTGGYNDTLGLVCLAAAKRIKDPSKKIFTDKATAKYDPDLKKRVAAILRVYAINPSDAYALVSFHGMHEKDDTVCLINDEKALVGFFELNKADKTSYQDDILPHLRKAVYMTLKTKVEAMEKDQLEGIKSKSIDQARQQKRGGKSCVVGNYYVGMPLEHFIVLNKLQEVKAVALDWKLNENKVFVLTEMAFDTKNIYKATGLEKSEFRFGIPSKLGIAGFEVEMTDIKYNRNYIAEAFGSYDFNSVTGGEVYFRSENQAKGVVVTMWEKSGKIFIRSID